ncbi:alpha/beta hydrolase [Myxococcota bacterium]|nr:alpha/beta hydrolase [Myxococcota bacterium]
MRRTLALALAPALLLLAPLAGCSLTRVATSTIETQARTQGLEERRVALGGRQVRYWTGGEGPPLLLIHGFGGDGLLTWARQVGELSRSHTLIIPDLLWFGQSFGLGVEPSITVQVQTMVDLLDHLRIERVDVAGISYGGFVTLLLQQQHPERTDRVIIVDSPGPVFDAADRQAMLDRLGVSSPEEMFVPAGPEEVARLIEIVRPGGPAIPPFLLRDIQRAHFSRNHEQHRALLGDLVEMEAAFPPGTWRVPERSLVIWGSEDPVFPLQEGQELAQALGAELVVLEGAAHGPNFQQPRAFNRAVLDFLDGPAGGPGDG